MEVGKTYSTTPFILVVLNDYKAKLSQWDKAVRPTFKEGDSFRTGQLLKNMALSGSGRFGQGVTRETEEETYILVFYCACPQRSQSPIEVRSRLARVEPSSSTIGADARFSMEAITNVVTDLAAVEVMLVTEAPTLSLSIMEEIASRMAAKNSDAIFFRGGREKEIH
ncbi:hypothetical protein V6N12_065727 [Hibiscus sabdariffa]|uniref:Uncharacterized protein n=1 Tax=Hibiscus sabdariffa TaxID=183260 RepID=A0ABR2GAC6_9ROSI